MSVRPVRIVAVVLSCAAGLVAEEGLGVGGNYTWSELQDGKDIHEGIYNHLSGGEFDEWRLSVGLAPAIDRIQVKSNLNGDPYPGPIAVETDRVVSRPPMAPSIELAWVLGDFDVADQGWYYALGFGYQQRSYRILYAIGTESPVLKVHQFGPSVEYGYMWYLSPTWRFEVAPRLAGGMLINQFDSIDLATGDQNNRPAAGAWIEVGARAAVAWHPAKTQAWHIGLSADYRSGYGQVILNDEGPLGTTRSEARLWWYGFGYSLYYGHRF